MMMLIFIFKQVEFPSLSWSLLISHLFFHQDMGEAQQWVNECASADTYMHTHARTHTYILIASNLITRLLQWIAVTKLSFSGMEI